MGTVIRFNQLLTNILFLLGEIPLAIHGEGDLGGEVRPNFAQGCEDCRLKHKNIAGSKGLRSLAGFGAEPRLSSNFCINIR